MCMTHSPKRKKSAVFAEFHEFLSYRSFSICPLKNCFFRIQNQLLFYFFWNKKFIYVEKSAVFAEFHEFLSSPPQTNFWTAVSVFVPWKNAFFIAKTNFHFIFSETKNSYAEKSADFAEFHEFLSSPKFFFG